MKKVLAIVLSLVMLAACAGCSGGSLDDRMDKKLAKVKNYEDMLKVGAEMAETLLNADASEVGVTMSEYHEVNGKDLNYQLRMEDAGVTEFQLWLTGGGGVTGEEFEEIAACGIAQFGEGYDYEVGSGLISAYIVKYQWAHVKMTLNAPSPNDTGWVVITFTK